MKKFLLLPVLLAFPLLLSAKQENARSWRKTGDHWSKKNSITVSASLWEWSNYNAQGFYPINIEYDRALPYNLSVSAIGQYTSLPWQRKTDSYELQEKFWFVGVKANYNLPVVRNWLYFRMGVGVGVGFHRVSDISLGWCFPNGCGPEPQPSSANGAKFHAVADMYWVLRATKWLEFRFAPLLLSPSQVIFGSRYNSPRNDKTFVSFNAMGTLGVSVRF